MLGFIQSLIHAKWYVLHSKQFHIDLKNSEFVIVKLYVFLFYVRKIINSEFVLVKS